MDLTLLRQDRPSHDVPRARRAAVSLVTGPAGVLTASLALSVCFLLAAASLVERWG